MMLNTRKRKPFNPETEGEKQSILLNIACRYVPGWNKERVGRRYAVPYRVGRATDTDMPSTYAWFTGKRPVTRRALLIILEYVLRRARDRESLITEMEAKQLEMEDRQRELEARVAELEERLPGGKRRGRTNE